jgi:hypothetical protein
MAEQFTSQTLACTISTRMALANTRKGTMSVADYLAKMQGLANNMSTTRKLLDDGDLVQYILAGLDEDYDYVVNSVLARPKAITTSELASQMLSFEARVDLHSGGSASSANFVRHDRGGFGHGGPGRGCGGCGGLFLTQGRGGPSTTSHGGRGGNNSDRPQC